MSRFYDFQCPGSHDLENSDLPMADIPMTTPHVETSLLSPKAYLPRSFCISDSCRRTCTKSNDARSFGKFEWDPTVTDSSPPDYCCAAIHYCCTQSITTTTTVLAINDKYTLPVHCLLHIYQQSPPLALMATQAPTCIQNQLSFAFDYSDSTLFPKHFDCIRLFRLDSIPETFQTRFLSPPLTSMSKKKQSSPDLFQKHTPPVNYEYLGNTSDIQ
jgi:hypothetical protein